MYNMHNMHTREAAGAEVARRRRQLGMTTQADLAEKSGVGVRTISNIETGTKIPRVGTLRKLEIALAWKPGHIDALLDGQQVADPSHVPAVDYDRTMELRDEVEREIFLITRLEEHDRWQAIFNRRARIAAEDHGSGLRHPGQSA